MIYGKYARDLLVGAALRGGTITFPATYHLALLTAKPGLDDTYSEIGNVNVRNYARKSVVNGTAAWTVNSATNAISANVSDLVFNDPSGAWIHGSSLTADPVTHIGFFDSATIGAGNLWFYVPITPKPVEAYHTAPTIKAGTVILKFDK